MHGFWTALESLRSMSAVSAEWRELLDEDYEFAGQFLRPQQELANAYPCQRQPNCGCFHEVVEHGPDDFVAICVCRTGMCNPISLRRADIVVHEVAMPELAAAVASALDLTPAFAPSDIARNTLHVGLYYPHEGFRFPIYLSMCLDSNELTNMGAVLTSRNDEPFILLTPTRDLWSDALIFTIDDRKNELLALTDIVEWQDGTLRPRTSVKQVFHRFYESHVLGKVQTSSPQPFLFSADYRWAEIVIRIMDDPDKGLVHIGERQWNIDYHRMGMVDGRTGAPDHQWKLMLALAESNRRISCRNPGDADRFKQPIRRLRKTLRLLFPIPGDPLPFDNEEKAWIAAFDVAYLRSDSQSR